MSDGMRRAVLATLETRTWKVENTVLTGEQVVALYHALPDSTHAAWAIGDYSGSRKWDRAIRVLKNAGLVEFVRKPRPHWRRIEESAPTTEENEG